MISISSLWKTASCIVAGVMVAKCSHLVPRKKRPLLKTYVIIIIIIIIIENTAKATEAGGEAGTMRKGKITTKCKKEENQGKAWHQQGVYHIKWGSGTDEMPSEMVKKVKKMNEKESSFKKKRETWKKKRK